MILSCIRVVLALVAMAAAPVGGAATGMERADQSIESLEAGATVVIVGTCTRIETKAQRNGGFEDTTYFHHLKVDRVCRAGSSGVVVGSTVAVISATHHWVGEGLPPPSGSGHRGMPAKGERMRVYARFDAANQGKGAEGVVWLQALEPNGWQPPARTVLFVAADDEYRSEDTMPKLASWLERDAPGVFKTMQAFAADPTTGVLDVQQRSHIANLDKLDHAEAAVLYMRWRELDDANWKRLDEFLMRGRPVVGFRTTTHMLRMKNPALDDQLPIRVFGQKWIRHAGHDSRTRILPPESDHPIVRGIRGGFVVRSWLYEVEPLPADCKVLLWGEVVGGTSDLTRQPILWVREATKDTVRPFGDPPRGQPARRMAFTTLGHPEDFEHEEVRRLAERMVLWACEEDAAASADAR